MQDILLIAGILCYVGVAIVIAWRIRAVKKGVTFSDQVSLASYIDPKIDTLAYYIVVGSREIIKRSYVLVILLGEQVIKLVKRLVIKVEKRFAKIVNQVKGKGEISQKGSVSLFLKEIKDHQNQVKQEIGQQFYS